MHRHFLTLLVLGGLQLALAGCITTISSYPIEGKLSGVLLLKWNSEDGFIYEPDPRDPLTYRRPDKPPVRPGRMLTEGGSIPRVFWGVKHFSPWAYGPAYALHDWLYHQHRCHVDTGYSFEEANAVLADAIRILEREGRVDPDATHVARTIKWAVDTFGQTAYNEPCDPAPTFRARRSSITVKRFRFAR